MRRGLFHLRRNDQAGFTLVELGVVMVILSIVMALAVQSYMKASEHAKTSVVLNDFRVIAGAVENYNQENGAWPKNAAAGVMPKVLNGYLNPGIWTEPTPIGGYFTWATNSLQRGTRYQAVIIIKSAKKNKITTDKGQLTDIDKTGDNGNTTTGTIFLGSGNSLVYVVEK